MNKLLLLFRQIVCIVIISIFVSTLSPPAYASFLDDVIKKVSSLISPSENSTKSGLTIDSNIMLLQDGDIDKNDQIDSGDIVRFEYVISNPTDTDYLWMTLKTNINRKLINFIHNIYGTTNIKDTGETIDVRNVRIPAKQKITFRFDARVNYSSKKDLQLTTEPQVIDKDEKVVTSSIKQEKTVRKLSPEKLEKILEKQSNTNRITR